MHCFKMTTSTEVNKNKIKHDFHHKLGCLHNRGSLKRFVQNFPVPMHPTKLPQIPQNRMRKKTKLLSQISNVVTTTRLAENNAALKLLWKLFPAANICGERKWVGISTCRPAQTTKRAIIRPFKSSSRNCCVKNKRTVAFRPISLTKKEIENCNRCLINTVPIASDFQTFRLCARKLAKTSVSVSDQNRHNSMSIKVNIQVEVEHKMHLNHVHCRFRCRSA